MSVFLGCVRSLIHTDSLHLVVGIFIALPSSSPPSLTALPQYEDKRERGVRSQNHFGVDRDYGNTWGDSLSLSIYPLIVFLNCNQTK